MNVILVTVIILVILLIFIRYHENGIASFWEHFGEKPKFNSKKSNLRSKKLKITSKANDLYLNTIGYSYDDTAKAAVIEATIGRDNPTGNAAIDANAPAVLANLERYNILPNMDDPQVRKQLKIDIANNYGLAIAKIASNPIEAVADTGSMLSPEEIIDMADNFYRDWIEQDINNIIILPMAPDFEVVRNLVREARRSIAKNGVINPTDGTYTVTAPITPMINNGNATVGDAVRMPAAQVAGNFYAPRPVYNDPQNVHDPAVTGHSKYVFQRIREHNNVEAPDRDTEFYMQRLREQVQAYENPDIKRRAGITLDTMSIANEISNLESNERDVIASVYKRILSPQNEANRAELTKILLERLAESVERNSTGNENLICATGRCTRVLGALSAMDVDPEIARPPVTTGILRNEVLSKANKILQDDLKSLPDDVRTQYNNNNETAEVIKFQDDVKEKIRSTIVLDYQHLEKRVVDPVIDDALAGV